MTLLLWAGAVLFASALASACGATYEEQGFSVLIVLYYAWQAIPWIGAAVAFLLGIAWSRRHR